MIDHLGFLRTQMTESPLRNILGMYLVLVTGEPFLPFLGISVQTSVMASMTMFMCLSNAFTFPNNFLLFLSAINTSLLAFTDLVNSENGPTLKVYYCGRFFYSYISSALLQFTIDQQNLTIIIAMSSDNIDPDHLLDENKRQSLIQSSHEQSYIAYPHEEHHIQSGQYLKSAVYGGLDGVVNTLTVILGGIGSGSNPYAIMAIGISVLFSDGMGMGLGDYLSSKSESEFIKAEKARQLWEVHNKLQQQKRQIKEIYIDKGYTRQQAVRISDLYSTNDKAFVNIMMLEQLGLVDSDSSPFWNGVVTLAAFILFGFLPLIPYVIGAGIEGDQKSQYLAISLVLGCIELFSLGFAKAVLIGLNKFKAGMETLILGGLAIAVGYGIGLAFQVDEVSAYSP